ncbi:MAG: 50S ribosomal protein L29 [Candidatus Pacearchaeota archaeon]
MAIIRKNELKTMNKEEMLEKIKQLEFEILKLRGKKGQASTGTKKLKEIKKTIARIYTKLKSIK